MKLAQENREGLPMEASQVSEIAVKPQIAVVNREVLWEGGVVAVKVPKNAAEMRTDSLHYLMFPRFLKGGIVNMFVHIPDGGSVELGKTTYARAKVMRKDLADGRQFLHVDLHPVAEETPVTHRIAVVPETTTIDDDWTVFKTIGPIKGLVVVSPEDAKLKSAGTSIISSLPAKVSSDDPQLDRLMAAGWTVVSDLGGVMKLGKMKKGEWVQMTHYPKKKK